MEVVLGFAAGNSRGRKARPRIQPSRTDAPAGPTQPGDFAGIGG